MGLFQAVLDAIFYQDDLLAGQRVTRLTAPLLEAEVGTMAVEATNGFGVWKDGGTIGRVLVGGELIEAATRTLVSFDTLTRGVASSKVIARHEISSLVYDAAGNMSAFDHVRRGILVDFAIGEDLDTIGANLGLARCPGVDDETWREVIKAVAYLPKQTLDAFERALTALLGAGGFNVYERTSTSAYQVFVEIVAALATEIRGTFYLNGGEPQLTTGANTVDVDYDINGVLGVYDDTTLTRRGYREGLTNYYDPGGSFVTKTVTMGTSPGGASTPVIVDYGAFTGHYLAPDETERDAGDDFYAYLSDPTLAARCLLDQIRAAGIVVNFSVVSP